MKIPGHGWSLVTFSHQNSWQVDVQWCSLHPVSWFLGSNLVYLVFTKPLPILDTTQKKSWTVGALIVYTDIPLLQKPNDSFQKSIQTFLKKWTPRFISNIIYIYVLYTPIYWTSVPQSVCLDSNITDDLTWEKVFSSKCCSKAFLGFPRVRVAFIKPPTEQWLLNPCWVED